MSGRYGIGKGTQLRHRPLASDKPIIKRAVVALDGDIESQAMRDDGDRKVGGHFRARKIQRHRRAGHVRNNNIGHHRNTIGRYGQFVERRNDAQQPWNSQRWHVHRHRTLHRAGEGLGFVAGHDDRGKPLARVGNLCGHIHQHHRHLIALRGITRRAQTHRDRAYHRLGQYLCILGEIAAQRARHHGHDDIVELGIKVFGNRLGLGQ